MNSNENPYPVDGSTSFSWKPTDEMMQKTIEAFKNSDGLWEEFKHVEVTQDSLMNEVGERIRAKIQEINPTLNTIQMTAVKMNLRRLARKEAGIIDKPIMR